MGSRHASWALPLAGFGIPLLAVLLAIVTIEPYYGVVDDGALLGYVSQVGHEGFVDAWSGRVWTDIWSWGMVRPFYWAIAYVQYRAGTEDPLVLYTMNWAALGAILVFAGFALTRAFRIPPGRRSVFLAVYGAAVFVYPWTLDLFAFASYQEKWVVLAAAAGLLWFAEPRDHVSAPVWYTVSLLVVVLGSLTKAQFLIFVPAFLLLIVDAQREARGSWRRVGAVAGAGALVAIVFRVVAWHGEYTQGYGLGNVPAQLRAHFLWLQSGFALAWLVYVLVRERRGTGTLLRDLIPIAVFVSFVVVFAQWAGGFLYSLTGFVFAGAFALLVSRLRSKTLVGVVLVATLVWACAWVRVRTNELYSSLESIGEFARSAPARQLAAKGVPVYISCQEGSQAIAGYVRREQGLPLNVRPQDAAPWSSAKGLEPPPGFRYALADDRLCPASIDPTRWQRAWTPSRSGGFILYRRVAG
jgi:hypothetical protein